MANVPTERIRNIVLLSHSGAGKTILAEAMLHTAGVTTRLGTVEDGTTASDFEAEEQRRGTSVNTVILNTPWRDHKINVIDTPGYADFRGEVMSGIRVADAAILVVAGQAGVEVGTGQMWRLAEPRDLPTVVYVSKLDRENASFDTSVAALQERFGRHLIPVHVPVGAESEFSGVVDLLKSNPQVPDSVAGEVEDAMERLTEAVAEIDDDLATKYLEGEEITSAEIIEGVKQGLRDHTLVPILAGAPLKELGVSELLDFVVDYLPSPDETAPVESSDETVLPCDSGGPLAALVFKTAADPFVGKLSYFRVYSGTFKGDTQLLNANRGEVERVAQVFEVRGKAAGRRAGAERRRHRSGDQAELSRHRRHDQRQGPTAVDPGSGRDASRTSHGGLSQVQGRHRQDDQLPFTHSRRGPVDRHIQGRRHQRDDYGRPGRHPS